MSESKAERSGEWRLSEVHTHSGATEARMKNMKSTKNKTFFVLSCFTVVLCGMLLTARGLGLRDERLVSFLVAVTVLGTALLLRSIGVSLPWSIPHGIAVVLIFAGVAVRAWLGLQDSLKPLKPYIDGVVLALVAVVLLVRARGGMTQPKG